MNSESSATIILCCLELDTSVGKEEEGKVCCQQGHQRHLGQENREVSQEVNDRAGKVYGHERRIHQAQFNVERLA